MWLCKAWDYFTGSALDEESFKSVGINDIIVPPQHANNSK